MKENKNIENNIQENELITINRVTYSKRSTSNWIAGILCAVIIICTFVYYSKNYAAPKGIAANINNVKISNTQYDNILNYFKGLGDDNPDMQTKVFLKNTIILSKKATELGLTVTNEEINKSKFAKVGFGKEDALVTKLYDYLEKNVSYSDENIKNFYEDNKNQLYVVSSSYDVYSIKSQKTITNETKLDFDKMPINTCDITTLDSYGIKEPQLNKLYDIGKTDDGFNRWLYIKSGETKYLALDNVKDSIKEILHQKGTEGKITEFLEEGSSKYKEEFYK